MSENNPKFRDRLKKLLIDSFLKLLPKLPLLLICWSIGFYLLKQSSLRWSIDDEKTLTTQLAFIFLLSIFLILIPLVKSIKFLNIFELEREIKETKEEVKDFKTEIRQSFSMLTSSLSASIGNMNNNITVQIPGVKQLKKDSRIIEQKGKSKDEISIEEIKEELSLFDDEDTIMALVKTRVKIEYLLREILNKRTNYPNEDTSMKFLSLNQLFKQFTKIYPDLKYLESSFHNVLQICNAAVHGLNISFEQADETLKLGARIIRELEYFKDNGYR